MSECCCDSTNKMMTVEELADYISISKNILYKGVREKSLGIPHIKINKAARFLKSDIDAWINMNRESTGPEVLASLKTTDKIQFSGEVDTSGDTKQDNII